MNGRIEKFVSYQTIRNTLDQVPLKNAAGGLENFCKPIVNDRLDHANEKELSNHVEQDSEDNTVARKILQIKCLLLIESSSTTVYTAEIPHYFTPITSYCLE